MNLHTNTEELLKSMDLHTNIKVFHHYDVTIIKLLLL
jgi:hypothetical protein